MTQAVFAAIKIKGILDTSDLEDSDEEDIENTFTNMCCPPLTVTAGISVPVQGIIVSDKSHKHFIFVSIAARRYKSVGHDLKPDIMNWKVLKELDLYCTSIEDKNKQDGSDVPVIKKD